MHPLIPVAALFLCTAAHAQEEGHNHLRLHYSKSSETDLVTVVIGDYQRSPEANYLIGATWGHDLSDTLFGLPFPMSWHLGAQYFNERGYQDDGGQILIPENFTGAQPLRATLERLALEKIAQIVAAARRR